MKAVSLTLILAYLSVGNALASPVSGQTVLGDEDGIDLDLQDMRLVEMEGQPPVWMTELEKVWRYPPNCIPLVVLNLTHSSRPRWMESISLTCNELSVPFGRS